MSDKTNKTDPVTITKQIEKGDLPRDIARALDHLWCFVADDLDENGEEDVQIDDIRVNCTGDLIVTFTRNMGKSDITDANGTVETGKVALNEQRKDDIAKVLVARFKIHGTVVAATIKEDEIEVEYEDTFDQLLQRHAPDGMPYEYDTKTVTFDRSYLPGWANGTRKFA